MKRILSVALALLLMLGLAACGGEDQPIIDAHPEIASQEEDKTSKPVEVESSEEKSDEAWREFLADYEAWVDDYVALYKKYQSNPTDMALLSEYTKLAGEVSTWSTRADEVQDSLEAEDLAEYTSELARIVNKLSSALY